MAGPLKKDSALYHSEPGNSMHETPTDIHNNIDIPFVRRISQELSYNKGWNSGPIMFIGQFHTNVRLGLADAEARSSS